MGDSRDNAADRQDASLVARVRSGDRAAESEVYRRYCDCVFTIAMRRTGDRETARELVNDVLMAVITALRRNELRVPEHLPGFVRGTARNVINSHFRMKLHALRIVQLDDEGGGADPVDDYDRQDRQRMVDAAMEVLEHRDRQILYLSLVEGLKSGEIAARLHMSPELVRQRKCRALRAMVVFAGR